MKSRWGIYFLIAIMTLMLVVLFISAGFQYMSAKLLPMIIAGAVFVLAGVKLLSEALGKEAARGNTEIKEDKPSEGLSGRYIVEGAWMVGFFLAIYLVGFVIAMPLFILSYLRSHGRRWSTSVIMAVVITMLLYGIFSYFLGISLYRGLVFELRG